MHVLFVTQTSQEKTVSFHPTFRIRPPLFPNPHTAVTLQETTKACQEIKQNTEG